MKKCTQFVIILSFINITAKTHEFENPQEIMKENINFRLVINQTRTYTKNIAQLISNYLKPLCKSEYIVIDTQSFSQKLSTLPPLKEDREDVSYYVESPFSYTPFK